MYGKTFTKVMNKLINIFEVVERSYHYTKNMDNAYVTMIFLIFFFNLVLMMFFSTYYLQTSVFGDSIKILDFIITLLSILFQQSFCGILESSKKVLITR